MSQGRSGANKVAGSIPTLPAEGQREPRRAVFGEAAEPDTRDERAPRVPAGVGRCLLSACP